MAHNSKHDGSRSSNQPAHPGFFGLHLRSEAERRAREWQIQSHIAVDSLEGWPPRLDQNQPGKPVAR